MALLGQAGIVPDFVIPASIDERVLRDELPEKHALRLALAKALAAEKSCEHEGALVLAADTVVACGRRILPKASSDGEVRQCLQMLSGRRHRVITAVALAKNRAILASRAVQTRVSFRSLSATEIDSYAQSAEGLGKAGGYAIQGRAEIFVKSINGSYSNVVGLPLADTVKLLRGHGFPC
jgi:septum formation protein